MEFAKILLTATRPACILPSGMGARTTLFELVDRIFEGSLDGQLREWHAARVSFDDMAHEIRREDIVVSGETVRQWCVERGIHVPRKKRKGDDAA